MHGVLRQTGASSYHQKIIVIIVKIHRIMSLSRSTQLPEALFVCVEVYGPVYPMGSYRALSIYLTPLLLHRLSPLSG